jgi:hypothetical protein
MEDTKAILKELFIESDDVIKFKTKFNLLSEEQQIFLVKIIYFTNISKLYIPEILECLNKKIVQELLETIINQPCRDDPRNNSHRCDYFALYIINNPNYDTTYMKFNTSSNPLKNYFYHTTCKEGKISFVKMILENTITTLDPEVYIKLLKLCNSSKFEKGSFAFDDIYKINMILLTYFNIHNNEKDNQKDKEIEDLKLEIYKLKELCNVITKNILKYKVD